MKASAPVATAAAVAATGLAASVAPSPSAAAPDPTTSEGAVVMADDAAAARATVTKKPFGVTAGGEQVDRYTLTNTQGMRMKVLTYGGVIQKLRVPDRDGKFRNVVLGLASVADYEARSDPYFGALIGRYGNRIAGGRFTLDGQAYELPTNNGPNSLHGGDVGFDDRVWRAKPIRRNGQVGLALRLTSEDGDQGYPGTVEVKVTYLLRNDNSIRIRYRATTDAPTVVNLTQHSYFNLQGEGRGTVYGHRLRLDADRFTPVDETLIPTGELRRVEGTPFDFRRAKPIGRDIRDATEQIRFGGGYDHNWVLNGGPGLKLAARVHEPDSGRTLTIRTEEPGVQFYSGNFLNGTLVGPSGRAYRQGDGFALETQHFPDSPNQPEFPSTVLRPGEVYDTTTVWEFTAG
jgi:aldose 1-epimerase